MRQQLTVRHHAGTDVGSDCLEGLISVASVALRDRFPETRIDPEDLQSLVDALLSLAPENAKVKFARATLHFLKREWQEGADIYRALVKASERLPHSQAMLALTLNKLQDPEWRLEADSLRDSDDVGVSYLARSLIARDTTGSGLGPFEPEEKPATTQPAEHAAAATSKAPRADTSRTNNSAPTWVNYGLRA